MPENINLIYILLPLLLSAGILILVLVLIGQLRRDVKLSKLTAVSDRLALKIDETGKILEGRIRQFEEKLEAQIRAGNTIMDSTSRQIAELDSYSADLTTLKNAMTTYHRALDELSDLTVRSETKLSGLEKRAEIFKKVSASIDQFENEFAEINRRVDEFTKKTQDRIEAYEAGNAERITAFEARIGGVVGAFEARLNGDLKQFDSQMEAKIEECQSQIASDVAAHEHSIREIKDDGLRVFDTELDSRLESAIDRLNQAYGNIAASAKDLSVALDERSSALREIVEGFDGLADEKLKELDGRYERLIAEKARLDSDKQAAMAELDALKDEKLLLESLIDKRMSEVSGSGDGDTGVKFVPFESPIKAEESGQPGEFEYGNMSYSDYRNFGGIEEHMIKPDEDLIDSIPGEEPPEDEVPPDEPREESVYEPEPEDEMLEDAVQDLDETDFAEAFEEDEPQSDEEPEAEPEPASEDEPEPEEDVPEDDLSEDEEDKPRYETYGESEEIPFD